jgi:hypothetical protein
MTYGRRCSRQMIAIWYGIKVFDVDVYSTYLRIAKFLGSRKLFPLILKYYKNRNFSPL